MALFDGIVKKVLSEIKKVTTFNYRDIPEDDFVNGPVYVYHMTAEANLKGGLLKSG
ncbi:unknown [Prevotella sp. CAG:1092]|nr:unknown [Prevotella sp. CAG:1092]